jgi:hypothetical protein
MSFLRNVMVALVASVVVLSLERAGLLGAFLDALVATLTGLTDWLTSQFLVLDLLQVVV